MEGNIAKGDTVIVVTDTGSYEGIVHFIDEAKTRLTLRKVVQQPTGKPLSGLLNFYKSEIRNVRMLEAISITPTKEIIPKKDPSIMKPALPPKPTGDIRIDTMVSKLYKHPPKTVDNEQYPGDRLKIPREKLEELTALTQKYIIVDVLSEKVNELIREVLDESVIGVALEGVIVGRMGKLCWVNIATSKHVILFDILALGMEVFDRGLREVFQSENIVKVFHNCRLASDCLYHKFKVRLRNVFDTQVGDVIVQRQKYEEYPKYVRSLQSCCGEYLGIPTHYVYYPRIRDGYMVKDMKIWEERPLQHKNLQAAIKRVVFLPELRNKVTDAMMKAFRDGVNIYLSLVKDADEEEASARQTMGHMVPEQFLNIGWCQTIYDSGFEDQASPKKNTYDDRKRLLDTCADYRDPNIRFSRDIWHVGQPSKQ